MRRKFMVSYTTEYTNACLFCRVAWKILFLSLGLWGNRGQLGPVLGTFPLFGLVIKTIAQGVAIGYLVNVLRHGVDVHRPVLGRVQVDEKDANRQTRQKHGHVNEFPKHRLSLMWFCLL